MRMRRLLLIISLLSISTFGLKAQDKDKGFFSSIRKGIASFYHDKFEGRRTATGEVFDNNKFTAASNTHKLGTYLKVTNLSNGEVVYVRVNDRMSKTNDRLVDLASIAAKRLGFAQKGLAKVKVEAVPVQEGKRGVIAQSGLNKIRRIQL